jgi:outer membrane protein OmpA-like peptidoglycan-associated protein
MPSTWRPPLAAGIALILLALAASPQTADAQFFKNLKKTVKDAAESETNSQVDKIVRGSVQCAFDNLQCINNAEKSGQDVVLTDDDGDVLLDKKGQPVSDPEAGARIAQESGAASRPGEGAWANYDFQPGDNVLFFDDYTRDVVGDFPRRFVLSQGNFEVVDVEGVRYVRATSSGIFAIPLPETLPEQFTLEYSVNLTHGNAYARLMPGRAFLGPARSYQGSVVDVSLAQAGLTSVGGAGPVVRTPMDVRKMQKSIVAVRVMADGEHMKMYIGEQRVANAPNAVFPRSDTLFIAVGSAAPDYPILIGPMRVAGGGKDLYDRLVKEGRVSTQGVLFATNSARIRPESTPTLLEIGTMLQENPDLRIAIEGHTDSEGTTEFNQDLSERRAAAVKAYLVTEMRIDAARLQAMGFGESSPVASNETPEGRAQNRRVDLVRVGP